MSSLLLSTAFFRSASALTLSLTLFSCVIEEGPPRRLSSSSPSREVPAVPAQGEGGNGGVTTPPSNPPTSAAPMLVLVDTGEVMNADPGQGVGIFTEYAAGGGWHVWWTCDTALSGQDCDVAVSATAATGTITIADAVDLGNGTMTTPTASRAEARTVTTNEVHGFKFTTNPGAVITLEATVGGLREGPGPNRSFFFFVQDGKINGGYTGALTNPLQLQGKTP